LSQFVLERTIERPLREVYKFISDLRNIPRWQSGIDEHRVMPDGPTQLGSLVIQRRTFQGHTLDLSYKVVALEEDRRIELESTAGPVDYSVKQSFAEVDSGTRVEFELNVALTGAMRLAGRLIEPAVRRAAEADLDRLNDVLASSAQPGPQPR
jgi:uncharacterized membrane protein